MLPSLYHFISRSLTLYPGYSMSRNTKLNLPSSTTSLRSKSIVLKKLISFIQVQEKQKADNLLDSQFYQNIGNQKYLSNLLQWKYEIQCSVEYLFRDYPSILMNLQNQMILSREVVDVEKIYIQKLLVLVLYDHRELEKYIVRYQKMRGKTFFSVYVKCLCELIIGKFNQSVKQLFFILNAMQTMVGDHKLSHIQLIDCDHPNILNSRQQILFNLLIYTMFRYGNANQNAKKNSAMSLYKKIKGKIKLQINDLIIDNYEQFLNIWISAKHDRPMQWQDLDYKKPYYKYLYLLAQNNYIQKSPTTTAACNRILDQLPRSYPLRQFLQISQLYDQQQYNKIQLKFQQMQRQRQDKNSQYSRCPQFDVIIRNVMKILEKCQQQKIRSMLANRNNNEKESKNGGKMQKLNEEEIDDESVIAAQQNLILLEYNLNMKDLQSNGMPFYYLDIPFEDYILSQDFIKHFGSRN